MSVTASQREKTFAHLIVILATSLIVREVNAQLATHDLVVVQVSDGRRGRICMYQSAPEQVMTLQTRREWRARTGIWIVCEAKALGLTSLGVVDEAKPLDLAGTAENIGDLLLGKTLVMQC